MWVVFAVREVVWNGRFTRVLAYGSVFVVLIGGSKCSVVRKSVARRVC